MWSLQRLGLMCTLLLNVRQGKPDAAAQLIQVGGFMHDRSISSPSPCAGGIGDTIGYTCAGCECGCGCERTGCH